MTPTVNWKVARQEFESLINQVELAEGQDRVLSFDEVINGPPPDNARAYALRLQADAASSLTGHAFVNGKHFDIDEVGYHTFRQRVYPIHNSITRIFCVICRMKLANRCFISNRRYTLPSWGTRTLIICQHTSMICPPLPNEGIVTYMLLVRMLFASSILQSSLGTLNT
jgi:hypothetical protein